MNLLGLAYQAAGKLDRALPLLEASLRLMKDNLGRDDRETLIAIGNLGLAYLDDKKFEMALTHLKDSLDRQEAKLGPDDPDTLTGMNNLGLAYQMTGKWDQAVPLLEDALQRMKANHPRHPELLTVMNNLGLAYLSGKKFDLALPVLAEMLKLQRTKLGPDHTTTLKSMNNVGGAYQSAGRLDEALPYFEEAVKYMKLKNPDHPDTITAMSNLAMAYIEAKKLDLALPVFKDLVAATRKRTPKDRLGLAADVSIVGWLQFQTKSYEEAAKSFREAIPIYEKEQPDRWATFNMKSFLGGALLAQKKYAEAEPYLLEGYLGMKDRAAKIPPPGWVRLPEAAGRLVELYVALGKPQEADKWRAERLKYVEVAPQPREVKP
jgi:tetratricopeptide (TPR) repeat protein